VYYNYNNNIYLPVKAGCQKSTSSTMLATLETNDNDYIEKDNNAIR